MAIIGNSTTFRDVHEWRVRLAILERQVCMIERQMSPENYAGAGTGFLVAPDIIMTATHVVPELFSPSPNSRRSRRVRFDFVRSPGGEVNAGVTLNFLDDPEKVVFASNELRELDVALLRLAEPVGYETPDGTSHPRGWVELGASVPELEEDAAVSILQHAHGEPLKLAINTQSAVTTDQYLNAQISPEQKAALAKHWPFDAESLSRRFLHKTDTMPGSSGAPCFDIDWNFLGFHQGTSARFPTDAPIVNFGMKVSAIITWLAKVGLLDAVSLPSPSHARFAYSPEPSRTKDSALPTYLAESLAAGESETVEFKEKSLSEGPSKALLSDSIVKTVAALMNSETGGQIFLGVRDDGTIAGIAQEYAKVNRQRANWDGYQLWLSQVLEEKIDVVGASFLLSLHRFEYDSQDLCVIDVRPADRPALVKEELPIRVGARNKSLSGQEMLNYHIKRWPPH
ncbi:MAG: hypothetical protein GY748_09950 [Planctomycetaceae bacterium]|nr:hypothetical protein [Planctomycetaceae bacterium]